jgi:hypothetical protein
MGCTYEFMGKLYTKEQLTQLLQDKGIQNKIKVLERNLTEDYGVSNSPEETSYEFSEEDFVAFDDTIPTNDDNINFDIAQETDVDMVLDYDKLVKFKRNLLNTLNNRIANLRSYIASLTDKNKIKTNTKLVEELQERANILDQEIYNEKNAGETSLQKLKFQAQRDLERLDKLLSPNEALTDEYENLQEAKKILNFYKALELVPSKIDVDNNAFSVHPFFNIEEILGPEGKPIIADEIAAVFNNIAAEFKKKEKPYNDRQKVLLEKIVNSNPKVREILGEKSYDELMQNLDDAHYVDMWLMEANRGIFSKNGLIPQVALEIIQDNETESLSKHKVFEEKHNELLPKVRAALKRLNTGLLSGLKGVSYNIFFQQVLPGKTGNKLVNRFSQDYFDSIGNVLFRFKESLLKAQALSPTELNEEGDEVRKKAINNAYEAKQKWFRENTMMLDIRKLPEIAAIFPEFELQSQDDGGKHKQELIDQLGEIGYKEQLNKQVNEIKKYIAWRDSIQEMYLEQRNAESIGDLTQDELNNLKLTLGTHNPFNAAAYFYDNEKVKVGGKFENSSMNYNVTIPRRYKAEALINAQGKLTIKPTGQETGFYDKNYETIESDKDLKAYYDLISERMEQVSDIFPEEVRKNLFSGSLPMIRKTVAEILTDPNIPILKRLSKALSQIYENIKLGFGVNPDDSIYQDTLDVITNKAEPKVNASFLNNNKEAISERYDIAKRKLNNELKKAGLPLRVNKYTEILTDALPYPVTKLLADKLGIPATTNALKAKFGEKIKVGDVLYKLTISELVEDNSLDLPKIIKYYSMMGAEYEARQKSLPLISILKQHYNQIKTSLKAGQTLRTRANTQFESWFNRVVLGNTFEDKFGVEKKSTLEEKKTAKDKVKAFFKGRLLSGEDEKMRKDINSLINDIDKEIVDVSQDKSVEAQVKLNKLIEEKDKLIIKREKLGKRGSLSKGIDALLSHIRFLGLGYKLSSMVTNFLEGQIANMTIAATGDYFEPKHYYRAMHIVKGSIVKNATFGKFATNGSQKTRIFADRFDILQDSTNELQKASQKTALSYVDYVTPYTGNKRVEYLNQTPLMVAVMLDTEITGKNGKKSSLWDALEANGKLKPEFATKENIEAWEEGRGEKAQAFKKNVSNAIVTAHGNYDKLRGIMAKESVAGKVLLMFKTWIGSQLYQRLAIEQDDLSANAKGYKGRYRSHTKASAMLHGALIGGAFASWPGAVLGGVFGLGVAIYQGKAVSKTEQESSIGILKETLFLLKAILRKMIGAPISLITGKKASTIINYVAGKEIISEYSNYDKLVGAQFTERDKKNMRALVSEMSIQLSLLGFGLLVKQLLWDDDDEEDDPKRINHNILMNYVNQLQESAASYIILPNSFETLFGRVGLFDFCNKVGKVVNSLTDYANKNDISTDGANQGESKMLEALKKVTLPAIVTQDALGFETLGERQFSPTFYDDWFWDDEKVARRVIEQKRAVVKKELEKEGIPEEKIKKILDRTLKLPKDIDDPNSRTATKSIKKEKEKLTDEKKKFVKEYEENLKQRMKEEQEEEKEEEK